MRCLAECKDIRFKYGDEIHICDNPAVIKELIKYIDRNVGYIETIDTDRHEFAVVTFNNAGIYSIIVNYCNTCDSNYLN